MTRTSKFNLRGIENPMTDVAQILAAGILRRKLGEMTGQPDAANVSDPKLDVLSKKSVNVSGVLDSQRAGPHQSIGRR
jgi:hypothetical protein